MSTVTEKTLEMSKILELIESSINVKQEYLRKTELVEPISEIVETIVKRYEPKRKFKGNCENTLFIFGNGGSAADAQHIAAEFINRFMFDRGALPAIALTTDTSVLTSVGNDSNFKYLFSRQIEALGRPYDIAMGISTSGNSSNVTEGLKTAKERGLTTVALIGNNSTYVKDYADVIVSVPSSCTPRIQEVHIMIGHIICDLVEQKLFKKD